MCMNIFEGLKNFGLRGGKAMKDKHALLFESNQMKQKDKKVNDYVFNNKIVTHPDFVVHRSTILMQKWGILLMEKEKS